MLNIFLFLAIFFIITLAIGVLLERIRVPWLFAALLIGFILAISNPFQNVTSQDSFNFLATLGLYFLLFIIGFELDFDKIRRSSKFIVKSTFIIILFEALIGMLIVHHVFHVSWLISFIVALSFATVGEAVLVPILQEFRMINSKLGQAVIGIGVLDDVFEVLTLFLVSFVAFKQIATANIIGFLALCLIFVFSFYLSTLKEKTKLLVYKGIGSIFLIVIFILFLFIGIGIYANLEALSALLAGIVVKNFLPRKRIKLIEETIINICYGFFAPIFFLSVGLETKPDLIFAYPLLVLLVVTVSKASKIIASIVAGKKELGLKKSIVMGVALSVRFSTSIVIIKLLFEKNLIDSLLYSVLIASTMAFKFIIPVLLAYLIKKWKVYRD